MKKFKPLIITFTLLSLLFIWMNSFLPSGTSSRASSYFTKLAAPFLEIFFGKGNVTEHLVRKLAHLTEYAFYGLWLALWMKTDCRKAINALLAGFITGFFDETIQMFTGRGPSIKDVWIDSIGIIAGIGCIHLILSICRYYSSLKRNKE